MTYLSDDIIGHGGFGKIPRFGEHLGAFPHEID